jgi:hypothetical protein
MSNRSDRKLKAAAVIRTMRRGEALHLEYRRSGPAWRVSSGRHVADETARAVITNVNVVGVGDSLFGDALSQTWRYLTEE